MALSEGFYHPKLQNLCQNRLIMEVKLFQNIVLCSMLSPMEATVCKMPIVFMIIGSTMSSSSHVQNLGVIFHSTLSMTNHISTICRTAYMHLHNISRIQRYLTPEATKSLVHAFIMSRLDYGNALLAGRPLEHLKKLQRIQNIAARIITFTPRRDHITPILRQLHCTGFR